MTRSNFSKLSRETQDAAISTARLALLALLDDVHPVSECNDALVQDAPAIEVPAPEPANVLHGPSLPLTEKAIEVSSRYNLLVPHTVPHLVPLMDVLADEGISFRVVADFDGPLQLTPTLIIDTIDGPVQVKCQSYNRVHVYARRYLGETQYNFSGLLAYEVIEDLFPRSDAMLDPLPTVDVDPMLDDEDPQEIPVLEIAPIWEVTNPIREWATQYPMWVQRAITLLILWISAQLGNLDDDEEFSDAMSAILEGLQQAVFTQWYILAKRVEARLEGPASALSLNVQNKDAQLRVTLTRHGF